MKCDKASKSAHAFIQRIFLDHLFYTGTRTRTVKKKKTDNISALMKLTVSKGNFHTIDRHYGKWKHRVWKYRGGEPTQKRQTLRGETVELEGKLETKLDFNFE